LEQWAPETGTLNGNANGKAIWQCPRDSRPQINQSGDFTTLQSPILKTV
jgi:hypothetical protein